MARSVAETGRRQDAAERAQERLAEASELLRAEIRSISDQTSAFNGEALATLVLERVEQARSWEQSLFVPNLDIAPSVPTAFMAHSTCSADDFRTAEFQALCAELAMPPRYHRKIWEWAFIVHHLRRLGIMQPGHQGLAFGVGTEPLPSLFAKDGATIVATDAPAEVGAAAGWDSTQQYAASRDSIRNPRIIDQETFDQRLSYANCDMNDIGETFTDFDFCWSSCCLEHLGSLEAELDFVVNSVEKTLKIGGVACHTTEINLSSDVDTISTGETVLYRRQDLARLVTRLRERGHEVDDIKVAPDNNPLDFYVDVPPYLQNAHLKLKLMGYTSTSVGIVARRGG